METADFLENSSNDFGAFLSESGAYCCLSVWVQKRGMKWDGHKTGLVRQTNCNIIGGGSWNLTCDLDLAIQPFYRNSERLNFCEVTFNNSVIQGFRAITL